MIHDLMLENYSPYAIGSKLEPFLREFERYTPQGKLQEIVVGISTKNRADTRAMISMQVKAAVLQSQRTAKPTAL